MHPRVTSALEEQINSVNPAEMLDVVVELDGGAGEISDVSAAKQAFRIVAEPIIEAISDLNGEIRNRAWINHTLRARVLAQDIPAIADLESVVAIDVAHMIGHDAVHEPGDELLTGLQYMDQRTAASAATMIRSWRRMPREEFAELARSL